MIVIPGRAEGADPESRTRNADYVAVDSGFARFACAPE
jgi:hypothetical protein